MRRARGLAAPLLAVVSAAGPLALGGCQRRESVEAARARAQEAFLLAQVADLKELIARAEGGQLVTKDRIAIGVAEEAVKSLIDASLPREQMIGERVRVRIESAQAFFRGNNAALVFQASAHGRRAGMTARLEMGGRLADFEVKGGVLRATVGLAHLKVIEAPGGDLTADILERLARDHSDALKRLIPQLAIPVSLKESIEVPGLEEGVVMAKPGVLPLEVAVAETIPVNERLWILLDVKAGPWKNAAAPAKAGPPMAAKATPTKPTAPAKAAPVGAAPATASPAPGSTPAKKKP